MKAAELQGSGQGENGTFDIGSGYTGFSGGLPMLLGPCVDGPNLCHCGQSTHENSCVSPRVAGDKGWR